MDVDEQKLIKLIDAIKVHCPEFNDWLATKDPEDADGIYRDRALRIYRVHEEPHLLRGLREDVDPLTTMIAGLAAVLSEVEGLSRDSKSQLDDFLPTDGHGSEIKFVLGNVSNAPATIEYPVVTETGVTTNLRVEGCAEIPLKIEYPLGPQGRFSRKLEVLRELSTALKQLRTVQGCKPKAPRGQIEALGIAAAARQVWRERRPDQYAPTYINKSRRDENSVNPDPLCMFVRDVFSIFGINKAAYSAIDDIAKCKFIDVEGVEKKGEAALLTAYHFEGSTLSPSNIQV